MPAILRSEWEEKMRFVKQQVKETVDQDAKGVTIRLGVITCRCGWRRSIFYMYQCFYCNEWFCQNCAPDHFGKTREQYRKENPIVEATKLVMLKRRMSELASSVASYLLRLTLIVLIGILIRALL